MDFGDLGLADLVASWLDDRWRWTDAFGWMGHAGTHYVRHLRDTDALEYARTATLKAMGDLIDRLASGEKVEDDERDAIMDLVQDARRFKRVFDLSRGPLSVRAQDFDEGDARRWLNTPAGIIDLDTGETIGHSPEHLVSKCTGAPIGDVVGPVFSRFLAEALPDPQVRDYVQRLLGSHLYGSVREHLLAIFWGAGRNGKGTLRTAVIRALGDYGDELSPELLMTQKYTRHGTFKMRLRGLRSAWCSETEKGRRMSEAEVKNLTGGDPIEANFMHKDPITFDPSHHLILCTNHLPEIAEPDPALWARIRVIGWTESFEGREDHGLAEKLSSSAELAGVMRWLYDGYQEYRRVGLGMDVTPEAVKLATDDYKTETDNYAAFVDTWCERTKGKVTTTSGTTSAAVFAQWSRYCLANGIKDAGSAAAFAKELDRIGVPKVKTKVGAVFGLKVNPPDDAEDDGDGGVDPWS
jgi:putative DNA primase/helicase